MRQARPWHPGASVSSVLGFGLLALGAQSNCSHCSHMFIITHLLHLHPFDQSEGFELLLTETLEEQRKELQSAQQGDGLRKRVGSQKPRRQSALTHPKSKKVEDLSTKFPASLFNKFPIPSCKQTLPESAEWNTNIQRQKRNIIEGSLEVKLPTIWTDENQSREEAERRGRLEERRVEEKE